MSLRRHWSARQRRGRSTRYCCAGAPTSRRGIVRGVATAPITAVPRVATGDGPWTAERLAGLASFDASHPSEQRHDAVQHLPRCRCPDIRSRLLASAVGRDQAIPEFEMTARLATRDASMWAILGQQALAYYMERRDCVACRRAVAGGACRFRWRPDSQLWKGSRARTRDRCSRYVLYTLWLSKSLRRRNFLLGANCSRRAPISACE
jgi:hypothetical protein